MSSRFHIAKGLSPPMEKVPKPSKATSKKLAEIKIVTDGGPWATHNMPCPICRKKPAILTLGTGQFQPCWDCQKEGYETVKRSRWFRRMRKILGSL